MRTTGGHRTIGLVLTGLVAAAVVAVLVVGEGPQRHTLKARFAAALDITAGQEVRSAGSRVGTVDRVEGEGDHALVTLKVDQKAWPLPADTRIRLRWGSTTAYEGRFVQLVPGRDRSTVLADGDTVSLKRTSAPVEFDQMYTIFDRATRPAVQRLIGDLKAATSGRQQALRSALQAAPGGLEATSRVFSQLSRDRHALQTLVRSGAEASAAIAREDPHLRDLITHAAGTFDTFADQSRPVQEALDRLPGTLGRTREGLARVDASIPGLQALVTDLRPGADRLQGFAPVLRRAADRLAQVAPLASQALRAANGDAPAVTKLLSILEPFAPKAAEALQTFAPMAGCLRPYGPEIAGFFATWAGYTSRYDAAGHYARALPPVQPIPHGTPLKSADALKLTAPGSVSYAMPRPPGLNQQQPWFQPQCGAGPDALDATKDPESK